MDTTTRHAHALHRMLLRSFLADTRGPAGGWAATPATPLADDASETRPMLYRSEAFAEDLVESHPLRDLNFAG